MEVSEMVETPDSIMEELYIVVQERARSPEPGSYTNYLLDKVGQNSEQFRYTGFEIIIAAKVVKEPHRGRKCRSDLSPDRALGGFRYTAFRFVCRASKASFFSETSSDPYG